MLTASSLGHRFSSSTSVAFQICCRQCFRDKFLKCKRYTGAGASNLSTSRNVMNKPIRGRRQSQNGAKEILRSPSVLEIPDSTLDSANRPSLPQGPGKQESRDVTLEMTALPSTREGAIEFMRHFMLPQDIDTLLAEDILSPEQHVPPTITKTPPFAAGRPWSKKELKPIFFSALAKCLKNLAHDIEEEHRNHIQVITSGQPIPEDAILPSRFLPFIVKKHLVSLATTQDVEDAWHSYITLIDFITRIPAVHRNLPHIPYAHLHRLTRLLAANRPKTHRQYLRLLAVLTYLKHCGGKIGQHQYNALLDHSGKGWRKTREQELRHAKSVARELQMGCLPSLTEEAYDFENEDYPGLNPDIFTFTSLLATAARASNSKELVNIASLMQNANLPPNRITHLALLRYFTQKKNLSGVRSTLQKMRYQNMELGLDGLNACMWAYGRNERVDIVWGIYRLLRHNVVPETYVGEDDTCEVASLLGEEYIFVEPNIRPNEVTFTMLIQMMAYLGHFRSVLDLFHDMLTFLNLEQGAPLIVNETGELKPSTYQPRVAVYRNIFLGFTKHGIPKSRERKSDENGWTLQHLTAMFDCFLQLRPDSTVTYANVDIIMKAFSVTSEDDLQLMRHVWSSIEERFGSVPIKPTSTSRMMRLKKKLFPDQFSDNPVLN